LYGEFFGDLGGLDAPEGGESGHAFIDVRTRDHIGTKVRSFWQSQGGVGKEKSPPEGGGDMRAAGLG